ncbi:uncharacterized protein PAN0_125d6777 [Moesziomyces antarcticus]|uniref:Uncharacterized protein n=2 Tax=Pseudozyma antarctica TaxID=84753 RepID=A0A081CPB9_PSEA2|nr:uncharacterized protein PAN0_125d6777 [Moesziomyces antarcticus]GAK68515.1 conserved hypothetical protein [Moesziomyces antarcticus]SPO47271.1 related to MTW1 - component of the MIND kinetochore complex [Moesziomyces antarcticus]
MPSARLSSQAATASASASAPSTEAGPSTIPATSSSSKTATAAIAADKKEEASTDAHLELLTEHFGYNPKSFIDALVYLSNEHLYSIATEFENVVGGLLDSVDGGELEAEQGIHAILTLMENALDHTMDTFELYCFRSVFGIRPRQAKYMTLDHHRGLDLRPQQPTAEYKARPKGGRKSAVASTNSASERSYKLGETEDSLKRQIAAARATQHKLLLAQAASEQTLSRMLSLSERFSSILARTDSAPVLSETLGQYARKLRADTAPLLRSVGELRAADPLGAPLHSPSAVEADDDEGAAADVRAWQRGREGYLNWEADRIIAKSKRKDAPPSATTAVVGEKEQDEKTPKKKRIATATPASKRRTPASTRRA